MIKTTIEIEARAFAIWRYAAPRDWSVDLNDVMQITGLTRAQVNYVISAKGWSGRIRSARTAHGLHGDAVVKGRHRRGDSADLNRLDVLQMMGDD